MFFFKFSQIAGSTFKVACPNVLWFVWNTATSNLDIDMITRNYGFDSVWSSHVDTHCIGSTNACSMREPLYM